MVRPFDLSTGSRHRRLRDHLERAGACLGRDPDGGRNSRTETPKHVCAEAGPSVSETVERSCRPRSRTSPQTGSGRRTDWRGRTLSLSKRAGVGHVSTSSTCLRAGDPRSQEGEENETLESLFEAGAVLVVGLIVSVLPGCLAADVLPRSGVCLGRTAPRSPLVRGVGAARMADRIGLPPVEAGAGSLCRRFRTKNGGPVSARRSVRVAIRAIIPRSGRR